MHIMSSMVQKNNMSSKRQIFKIVGTILFIIYSCFLIYFLFFSEGFGRKVSESYSINLIPFREIKRFLTRMDVLGSEAAWINIGGNILAFVPFGFFIVPMLLFYFEFQYGIVGKFFRAVILTFNFSLIVELIQLVTRVGSFDVDDLILNTIGGIIGAGIYVLCCLIERKRTDG